MKTREARPGTPFVPLENRSAADLPKVNENLHPLTA
jgi:hypothetical protein